MFRLLVMWSSPHVRDSSFHQIRCKHFIQSGVIDIFLKVKMAAAAILDFQVKWTEFGIFRHVHSVVFELCAKFGSNICYRHWDRRHFVPDIHLMTSHELTSSFDFWSRGHLRMAVMPCEELHWLPVNKRINFRFRLLVMRLSPRRRGASF